MQIVTIAIVVIILVWIYIMFIRQWLAHKSPWARHFQWIHAVEDKLWERSRSILVSRLYWLGGIIIAIHEAFAAAGFDLTPVLVQLQGYVPENLRPMVVPLLIPAFLVLTGAAMEWLRRRTTTSLAEKMEE